MHIKITNNTKLDYLEGLRGVAALAVLVGHTLGAFWPGRKPMELNPFSPLGLLHIFYDGGFAVLIFFALSGYVLTYRAQRENGVDILTSTAIKRYPRLMIPALGSILLAYILLKFGLMFNVEAAKNIGSVWLGYFYGFEADFAVAVKQGIFGAIFIGETSYNSSLWTLTIEFYGALLIIGLAMALRKAEAWRYWFLAALIAAGVWSFGNQGVYYGTLIAGLFLGMIDHKSEWKVWFIAPAFMVALWLGGFNQGAMYFPLNEMTIQINGNELDKPTLSKSLGAIIMVLCILRSHGLKEFFSNAVCKFLGKISFSLYLVHVAVICSIGCFTFLKISTCAPQSIAAIIAGATCISVSIALSMLFELTIDRNSIKISGTASRFIKTRFSPMPSQLKE
jgi:peptidoglycan/LPS O-acetylase OafA/YrhL